MRETNNRQIGEKWEALVCEYLEKQNMHVIERNFHNGRFGEIDIIARDYNQRGDRNEPYIVFVEVKYRSTSREGDPTDAVNYAKRKKISRAALSYLRTRHLGLDIPIRFDVAAVDGNGNISYLKNAFDYEA